MATASVGDSDELLVVGDVSLGQQDEAEGEAKTVQQQREEKEQAEHVAAATFLTQTGEAHDMHDWAQADLRHVFDGFAKAQPSEDAMRMSTKLHYKRREALEMDDRLRGVKADISNRMQALARGGKKFLKKKEEVVTSLGRFKFYVEEGAQKRQKAERLGNDEAAAIARVDKQLATLRGEYAEVLQQQGKLQNEFETYNSYIQYLLQVVQESRHQNGEPYNDLKDIINRHAVLRRTNEDLQELSNKLTRDMAQYHLHQNNSLKDDMTHVQLQSSRMARLMKELEDRRLHTGSLESEAFRNESRDIDSQRVFTQVVNAMKNLYARSRSYPTRVKDKKKNLLDDDPTLKKNQADKVDKFAYNSGRRREEITEEQKQQKYVEWLASLFEAVVQKLLEMKKLYRTVQGREPNAAKNNPYDMFSSASSSSGGAASSSGSRPQGQPGAERRARPKTAALSRHRNGMTAADRSRRISSHHSSGVNMLHRGKRQQPQSARNSRTQRTRLRATQQQQQPANMGNVSSSSLSSVSSYASSVSLSSSRRESETFAPIFEKARRGY